MKRTLFVTSLLFLASGSWASTVSGAYIPTYQVTNNAPNPINDIVEFWTAPSKGQGGGILWTLDGGLSAAGDGATTSFSDLPKPVYPDGLLVMGTYDDSEGSHLALFMNPTTAAAEEGIDFGTVFPNTNESTIISDLVTLSNDPNSADWNQPLNDLFGFAFGDAQNIPNGGSTLSAWLTPAPSSQPTPGKVEIWSSETEIGTFTARVIPQTPVPGPAALLPFLAGAAGLARRRKA